MKFAWMLSIIVMLVLITSGAFAGDNYSPIGTGNEALDQSFALGNYSPNNYNIPDYFGVEKAPDSTVRTHCGNANTCRTDHGKRRFTMSR